VVRQVESKHSLAIPLDGSKTFIALKWKADPKETINRSKARPIQYECIRNLPSLRFKFKNESGNYFIIENNNYESYLLDLIQEPKIYRSTDQIAEISVNDLLELTAQLGDQVHKMHGSGFIHGDINPNNVLITKEGAMLIDSLDIPINNVAHAGTPGWAAPEQVLVKSCTAATDVYALGLLLILFLDGAL